MDFFTHKIWDQILDGAQGPWAAASHSAADLDLFDVEVVRPLRELRDMGCIRIDEVRAPMPARLRTVKVFLVEVLRDPAD